MGAKPTWLKPQLVCEVAFAEVTSDGVFRQASFKGMRTDKKAKDVTREKPVSVTKITSKSIGVPIIKTAKKNKYFLSSRFSYHSLQCG